VRTMVGWRETFAVWPALVVVGGSFAAVQFCWANFVGFELVDIVSSVASLAAGVILLRFWRPARVWRFDHDPALDEAGTSPTHRHSPGQIARAWMPFGLLTATVLVWGIPAIEAWKTPAVKAWLDLQSVK